MGEAYPFLLLAEMVSVRAEEGLITFSHSLIYFILHPFVSLWQTEKQHT